MVAAACAAVGMAALAVAWPLMQQRLSSVADRMVRDALDRAAGSWSVSRVRVMLPATLQIEALNGRVDPAVELQARSIRLGVDVTAAARSAYSGEPVQQAVRHVEARGLVIRPQEDLEGSPAPAAGGGAGEGEGNGPQAPGEAPSPEAFLRALRRAALWLVREGASVLSNWVDAGGELTWDLEGIWVEPGQSRAWRSQGRLSRGPEGAVQVDGYVELAGWGQLRLTGRLREGQLTVDAARVNHLPVGASATGTLSASDDGGIVADLQVRLWPLAGWGWSAADARLQGPWPDGGLPPATVSVTLARPQPPAPGWWPYLDGGQLRARLEWREGRVHLSDGQWRRGRARGNFSGHVAPQAPFALALQFELWGLLPGTDVPWWGAYQVASVAARGRVEGSLAAPVLTAELQAPPGHLGGVPTGTATARLEVDLAAGRLRFRDLQAPFSTGQLTASGEVLWGSPAAGSPGAEGASVRLRSSGRVSKASSLDVAALLARLSGSKVPGVAAGAWPADIPTADRRAQDALTGGRLTDARAGELTGGFEVEAVWVAEGGRLAGRLRQLAFDGPDASVSVVADAGGHRIVAELINLSGGLLEPWLAGVRGFGHFQGRLRDGRLDGQLAVRELAVSDFKLGELTAPVELAGGWLKSRGVRLRDGEVEGQVDVALQLASCLCGRLEFSLSSSDPALPASLDGVLAIEDAATRLERLVLAMAGRPVASAEGTLPGTGAFAPRSLDLRLAIHDFPLELVQRWLPAGQIRAGQVTGQLHLSGTLEAPSAQGTFGLRAAALEFPTFPGRLTDLQVGVAVQGRQLTLTRAEARTPGGGRITASGGAQLASLWPVRLQPLDVVAVLDGARLAGRLGSSVELEGVWAGKLQLSGILGEERYPQLQGELAVRNGRMVLWREGFAGVLLGALSGASGARPAAPPASPSEGSPSEASPGGRPGEADSAGLRLQVQMRTGAPVRVEVPALGGSGLLEGAVKLVGTTRRPALEGELLLHQAQLRYFGREVRVERTRLVFSRARGLLPGVDLTAQAVGPSGPVTLRARGELSDPAGLELSSQPPLPPDQVAQLLLPSLPADSEDRAAWVEAVNEQLAAWAMAPVRDAVRQALGLDELWLVPAGAEGGWRLRLGKSFDPSPIYVRYGRTLRGDAARQELEVQSRLGPRLSVGAGWSEEAGMRLGVAWEFQF